MLGLHITGGALALLGAPVALAAYKGHRTHRLAGNVFFWGMAVVFVTAVYMSIAHSNPFLFMVGVFSFQMVLTGKRVLLYKTKKSLEKIAAFDWSFLAIALLSDLCLVAYGLYLIFFSGNYLGVVSIVFGLTGLDLVRILYRKFSGKETQTHRWLFNHIGNMIGGYIAAVTAFLVVNFEARYPIFLWLAPGIVGGGVIALFFSHYRKKLAGGKGVNELVQLKTAEVDG